MQSFSFHTILLFNQQMNSSVLSCEELHGYLRDFCGARSLCCNGSYSQEIQIFSWFALKCINFESVPELDIGCLKIQMHPDRNSATEWFY